MKEVKDVLIFFPFLSGSECQISILVEEKACTSLMYKCILSKYVHCPLVGLNVETSRLSSLFPSIFLGVREILTI